MWGINRHLPLVHCAVKEYDNKVEILEYIYFNIEKEEELLGTLPQL